MLLYGVTVLTLASCGDDEVAYTVTFETNGGTPINTQTYSEDDTLPEPTRSGHHFAGWFLNENLTIPFTWDDVETENVTVYAAWDVLAYTFTVIIDGETTTESLDYGTPLSNYLHEPTLEGHTFLGWFEDDSYTQTLSYVTMPSRDLTVYAKFEINTYTLTFENTEEAIESETLAYDTPITLPEIETPVGMHFGGWFVDETFEIPFNYDTMPAYDLTLYAKFSFNTHDAHFYVPTRAQLVTIVSGDAHAAALDSNGFVFTWGTHAEGRLGDGSQAARAMPGSIMDHFSLEPDETIVDLSAGRLHTFALTDYGRLFAWGFNGLGRLGDGSTTSRETPTDITAHFDLDDGETIANIYAGAVHNVALTSHGRVFTWGYNQEGQLGDGTRTMRLSPVDITDAFRFRDGETVISVALGTAHTLLATNQGRVFAWGSNTDGQLGVPTISERLTPYGISDHFVMPSSDSIKRVAASASHSFLLTDEGRLFAFGNNDVHQLALEDTNSRATPSRIDTRMQLDDEIIIDINVASTHGLVITNQGSVLSWGLNQHNQRGDDGASGFVPRRIEIDGFYEETFLDIYASRRHSFILTDEGDAFAFGLNTSHVLGFNGSNDAHLPTRTQAWHWTRALEDTVSYDASLDEQFIPEKTGHQLAGWFLEPTWESRVLTMPDAPTTLYAQFERAPFMITFDAQGGSAVEALEALYRARIEEPDVPERAGYTFIKWTLEGEPFTFSTMPAESITLEAEWLAKSFTITFDSKDGSAVDAITQDVDTPLTLETPEKVGHTFIGWFTEDGEPFTDDTMPAEDISLTASWERNTYTITIDTLGGDAIEPITLSYEASVETPGEPSREGYVFAGFYADQDYENPYTFDTMPAEDITVYVKWHNTLSFETYGGSMVESITKHAGESITQPVDPEKEGHTFGGWYRDEAFSDVFTFDTMPEPNTTLYAAWHVNTYTFTFDSNGGEAVEPIEQPFESTISAPPVVREGYTFMGWYDGDTLYDFDTVPAYDVHLTALWHNTITFDAQGGSSVEPITLKAGEPIGEPDAPEKVGHTFKGWYRDPSFDEPFTFETMPEPNITLYARWEINQYTITFETGDGSAVAPIRDDYNAPIALPEDPEKVGHTFVRWVHEDGETPFDLTHMPDNDVTVIAKWSVNTYTITFNTNQGDAIDPMPIDYGSVLDLPEAVREGYVFMGWYEDSILTDAFDLTTMPAEDLTLHAKWYNMIAFETYGGKAVDPIIQPFGTPVSAPPEPTKVGHTFGGWYEDETFETPYVFDLMERPNRTLYAQWHINDYTISFNAMGGSAVDAITLPFDTPITAPEVTREGYTFMGWYTIIEDSFPVEFDERFSFDTMPAKDVTLHAKWYNTLTFDSQGGDAVDPITKPTGSNIEAPEDPEKVGHTFEGWYEDLSYETPFSFDTMVEPNITLYAKWSVNSYTITFDSAGGSLVSSITKDYGEMVEAPDAPEKLGHTFIAWLYDGEPYDFETMPAKDINLTAEWSINEYTITFDSAGGSAVESITKDFAEPLDAPDAPEKLGYTFIDWHYNDEPYAFETMPAKNITVTAYWEVNTYTITFETYTDETIEPVVQAFNSDISLPTPTREGYRFGGWYASEDFDTLITLDTMPAMDMSLHAAWQRIITFDSDGGSAVEDLFARVDEPITAPQNPVKEGHTFIGWMIDEDPFSFDTMPDENIILTAQWEINEYTITFETLGGTHVETITITYSDPITLPDAPTRDDYDFAGWYVDEAYEQAFDLDTMPAESITLYAKWTPHEFLITYYDETHLTFEQLISNGYGGVDGFNIGLTAEGRVFSWGANDHGQLGNDTLDNAFTPEEITEQFDLEAGEYITDIYLGYSHAFAVTSENRLFGWGRNRYGQVGDGSTIDRTNPVDITARLNLEAGESIDKIDASNHTMVLTSEGRLLVWGYNFFGQLGIDTDIQHTTPTDITDAFGIQNQDRLRDIAAGSSHSLVVSEAGRVFTFGNNANGQLGNNTTTSSDAPVEITNRFALNSDDQIIAVYGGRIRSAALSENGEIFSFGRNEDGVLGDGTTTQRTTPVNITPHGDLNTDETIIKLSVGSMHTFAITNQDRLFGWGHNDEGQLMNGNNTTLDTPTLITLDASLNPFTIQAAHEHSTILDLEGIPYASGTNTSGELGTTEPINQGEPTQINALIWRVIQEETRAYTSSLETLFEPEKEGYDFNGWYINSELTQPLTHETMPNHTLILYASWIDASDTTNND